MFRPKKLDQLVGQNAIKKQLRRLISYAQNNDIPNVLFFAGAGKGKTTLCRCLASELGYQFEETVGTAIGNIKDLYSFLMGGLPIMKHRDGIFRDENVKIIFFIDEVHSVVKNQSMSHEIWLPLLEDKVLYHNLAGEKFNLMENNKIQFDTKGQYTIANDKDMFRNAIFIAGTTDPDHLNEAMRRRFQFQFFIDNYEIKDIAEIIARAIKAKKNGMQIDERAIKVLAENSRLNPSRALTMLEYCKLLFAEKNAKLDKSDVDGLMKELKVFPLGLQTFDILALRFLREHGMSGQDAICAYLSSHGISKGTYLSMIEPVLLEHDFIRRTARGRIITDKGDGYLESVRDYQ